ncbi:DUF5999 family protein [Actinoallomurus liliacearum]|uniref:DUF5999 family protein n=1 Tax=Actinoallomurus liliacearum TaxID=1080073 RepID=UPI003CD07946
MAATSPTIGCSHRSPPGDARSGRRCRFGHGRSGGTTRKGSSSHRGTAPVASVDAPDLWRYAMCRPTAVPPADAVDRDAAHTIASHPEQGWSLLCNGIVLFDDTGELLPDGGVIPPPRRTDVHPDMRGGRSRPRRRHSSRAARPAVCL